MDLDNLQALITVAETGSIRRAAERLAVSRSTVRRRLEALEEETGHPLVERLGRQITFTEAGSLLVAEGPAVLRQASALADALDGLSGQRGRGVVRVAVPTGLPGPLLSIAMHTLSEASPDLAVHLFADEDPLRRMERDVDLAIHMGPHRPQGPWVSRMLLEVNDRCVAHPEYLDQAGRPTSVEQLAGHRLLSWAIGDDDGLSWPLLPSGRMEITPYFLSNDVAILRDCVISRLGIALIPHHPLFDPEFEVILPELLSRTRRFWLVLPPALRWSPRVKAFQSGLERLLGPLRETAGGWGG